MDPKNIQDETLESLTPEEIDQALSVLDDDSDDDVDVDNEESYDLSVDDDSDTELPPTEVDDMGGCGA